MVGIFSTCFAVLMTSVYSISLDNNAKVVQADNENTRLLIELARHGAKASKKIYPLTVDEADNF